MSVCFLGMLFVLLSQIACNQITGAIFIDLQSNSPVSLLPPYSLVRIPFQTLDHLLSNFPCNSL